MNTSVALNTAVRPPRHARRRTRAHRHRCRPVRQVAAKQERPRRLAATPPRSAGAGAVRSPRPDTRRRSLAPHLSLGKGGIVGIGGMFQRTPRKCHCHIRAYRWNNPAIPTIPSSRGGARRQVRMRIGGAVPPDGPPLVSPRRPRCDALSQLGHRMTPVLPARNAAINASRLSNSSQRAASRRRSSCRS